MTYDDFMRLSEEEQRTVYIDQESFDNLRAERDSFRDENENLLKVKNDLEENLTETKKLNFTLARKLSTEKPKNSEEIIYEMFK